MWEGNAAIQLASQVILELDGLNDLNLINWIDYYNIDVMDFCAKPNKSTLLHEYIKDIDYFHLEYLLDKHFPMTVINNLTPILDFFGLDYSSIGESIGLIDIDILDDSSDKAEEYARLLLKFYVENLSSVIVNEAFTILFMNKNFLFKFNSQLSEAIRELKVTDYPKLLKKDGVIKRVDFPSWLKKGVTYRDKGRCQLCGTDLTRIFQNDNPENYDHIIPLELNGSNDPTNIQLTCEKCNKGKGARNKNYVNSFSAFWNL